MLSPTRRLATAGTGVPLGEAGVRAVGDDLPGKLRVVQEKGLVDDGDGDALPGDALVVEGADAEAGVLALLHHLGLQVLAALQDGALVEGVGDDVLRGVEALRVVLGEGLVPGEIADVPEAGGIDLGGETFPAGLRDALGRRGAGGGGSAAGREQEQGEEGWQEIRFPHGCILRFSHYVTLS